MFLLINEQLKYALLTLMAPDFGYVRNDCPKVTTGGLNPRTPVYYQVKQRIWLCSFEVKTQVKSLSTVSLGRLYKFTVAFRRFCFSIPKLLIILGAGIMTKISIKSMSDKELDAFIKRVEDAIEYNLSLDKADILMLLEAFKAMMFMQDKLAKNDLTILKLKKLLGMVSASEKLKGQMSEGSDTPPTEPKPKSKPSSTSGGKKPKDSFKNKETVVLPVEGFSKGDSCPECKSGKLYKFDPAEFLRVSGHAPFKATLYVKTRLRCNTCQHVVSAKLPDEVSKDGEGSQRYGYSARALMAIHKYASGLPFYRQESLQTMLGMSLSASTIFDQCEYLANAARPIVHDMTGIG